MYTPDYGNMKFLLEDRLREAEQHRKHQELVRAAREFARREGQVGRLSQWMNQLRGRNQPEQEAADARRAHAL